MAENRLFAAMLRCEGVDGLEREARRVTLNAGETACHAGGRVETLTFPESGMISVAAVMRSGDLVESGLIGVEGGVGVVECGGSGLMLSEATCVVGGEMLQVPARAFHAAFERSDALRRLVLDYGELLVVDGRQSLACTVRHSARDRLAWWLLECQDRLGGASEIPVVQAFMAARLGLQRTTVSTVASELEGVGAIRTVRGRVQVLDRRKLEREACECYATVAQARQAIGPEGRCRE